MKYLVNKYTKEHIVWPDTVPKTGADWHIVEPDSEGWIAHTGTECPLPEDVRFEYRMADGEISEQQGCAGVLRWTYTCSDADITHYKPILEPEKVQEPDYDPRSVSFNLLDRLKAAHAQAQTIPDLEAELREVLAVMGYDLVARSPFANQCCGNPAQCWEPCGELGKSEEHVAVAEPEPAVETPKGYALVPVEPTYKMLDALYNFIPIKYADKAGETMAYKSMLRMAAQYPEPVSQDRVIAGALFDFLGFLTTRDKPTSFGATRNASPAVELLKEWADKRGLDLSDADVESWRDFTAPMKPSEDMTDWRNWREGDEIARLNKYIAPHWSKDIYTVMRGFGDDHLGIADDDGIFRALHCHTGFIKSNFRFHSRPAKGEK